MYVKARLTDEKPVIHINKQGIHYTEIIPGFYALAVQDKDGNWQYTLKGWRWDIDALYVNRHITCLSLERCTDDAQAIEIAVAMFRRLNPNLYRENHA